MHYADVGPKRFVGMSPIVRRIPPDFDAAPQGEEEEIVHNLEGITHGVLDYAQFDDVPRAY